MALLPLLLRRAGWAAIVAVERERLVRGREKTKYEKIKKFRVFFANIHHRGTTWHATSVSDARVAVFGPLVKHLMYFRGSDGRFENLRI